MFDFSRFGAKVTTTKTKRKKSSGDELKLNKKSPKISGKKQPKIRKKEINAETYRMVFRTNQIDHGFEQNEKKIVHNETAKDVVNGKDKKEKPECLYFRIGLVFFVFEFEYAFVFFFHIFFSFLDGKGNCVTFELDEYPNTD